MIRFSGNSRSSPQSRRYVLLHHVDIDDPEIGRSPTLVVYMSGYTDDAMVHYGVLDPGTAFIEKPITSEALLTKLREFLS